MAPRKKRRLPQALQLRNTNEVVREESPFQDFSIITVLAFIILPICIYFLG